MKRYSCRSGEQIVSWFSRHISLVLRYVLFLASGAELFSYHTTVYGKKYFYSLFLSAYHAELLYKRSGKLKISNEDNRTYFINISEEMELLPISRTSSPSSRFTFFYTMLSFSTNFAAASQYVFVLGEATSAVRESSHVKTLRPSVVGHLV